MSFHTKYMKKRKLKKKLATTEECLAMRMDDVDDSLDALFGKTKRKPFKFIQTYGKEKQ